jgi:hypothetical protein
MPAALHSFPSFQVSTDTYHISWKIAKSRQANDFNPLRAQTTSSSEKQQQYSATKHFADLSNACRRSGLHTNPPPASNLSKVQISI